MVELSERVATLPHKPGVYVMKDDDGTVLYVGKAKSLKNRVRSYFSGGDGRHTVQFLMQRVTALETIITEDEEQALLLEGDLIKKFHPRYNIRLKDDKAYLLVRIDGRHEYPRLELVRRAVDDDATYIGPFAFAYEVREMLELIRQTLPLRTCTDRVLMNRVRPCLEYQMKRCAAPCCFPVDKARYQGWISQAKDILNGRNEEALLMLERDMERASEELRFEEAAQIRDRIAVLRSVELEKPMYSFGHQTKDALGWFRDGEQIEVSILSVRGGRLFTARTFGFEQAVSSDEELLSSFLRQFYARGHEFPTEILVPFAFEDLPLLEKHYGAGVTIAVPKKGDRARLLRLAHENAQENFSARFGGAGGVDGVLRALKGELGLEEVPRTIECVDISHFQGGQTVASLVFFQDGRPEKNRYRRFHLTQEGKPDDFASMREAVARHLSRCQEENTCVDLMVIDGGKAQLAQALSVRSELGLSRPMLIGLAKRRNVEMPYFARGRRSFKPERVYVEDRKAPVVLAEASKALHLLERVRDEAHRFAVTFHRSERRKKAFRSALDGIPGVGERRKLALLRRFGNIKAIQSASVVEVMEAIGGTRVVAERVLGRLNRGEDEAD